MKPRQPVLLSASDAGHGANSGGALQSLKMRRENNPFSSSQGKGFFHFKGGVSNG